MGETAGTTHFWNKYPNTTFWSILALITLLWLWAIGQGSTQRFPLLLSLTLASFMVGSCGGFLLSSYGEETVTVGKVRDWLVGGITGLTIGKFGVVKAVLVTFAAGPGPVEFALALSAAVVGFALGFFFMYFGRELLFNVLLAERRADRGRIEGTREAGVLTQRLLIELRPSLQSGVEDIDEILESRKSEVPKLRKDLYSENVQRFIEGADKALMSGVALDWDIISKAAVLHYYRMFLAKEDERFAEAESAYEWIVRALVMNPLHVDLTLKLADTLGKMDRYDEAVAILMRLDRSTEAPAYVKQWLGFFLLDIPGRQDEAIKYSEEYHAAFPDEFDTFYNIAYAYALKYGQELRKSGAKDLPSSTNRAMALSKLKEAIAGEPDYLETVRTKWTTEGEAFYNFKADPEFVSLVGPDKPKAA